MTDHVLVAAGRATVAVCALSLAVTATIAVHTLSAADREAVTSAAERIGKNLSSDCEAPGMASILTDAALTALSSDVGEAITSLPGEYGGVVTVRVEVLPGRTIVTDEQDGSRLCSAPAPTQIGRDR